MVHNQFEVASYDIKIEEEFHSPDNWLPGIETNKDVWIKNNREKSDISLNLPIADTVADAEGKWLLVSDVPDSEGTLLLYYIGTIAKEDRSPKLVDAVTMNPPIQPSVLVKKVTFNEQTGQWETTSVLNKTGGYDCARYTMNISATTVQATKDAVKNVFGTAQDVSTVVEHLTELAGDESTASAAENVKKLCFEEQNGKMVWNAEKGDSGNWFMDFKNMVPGGAYKESLQIENGSKKHTNCICKRNR